MIPDGKEKIAEGDDNYEVWRRLLLIEVTVSERQDHSSGFGDLVDRRLNPRLLSSKQLGIVAVAIGAGVGRSDSPLRPPRPIWGYAGSGYRSAEHPVVSTTESIAPSGAVLSLACSRTICRQNLLYVSDIIVGPREAARPTSTRARSRRS